MYGPHPYRKFCIAALQTWQGNRNTQWNNVWFLPGTATYQEYLSQKLRWWIGRVSIQVMCSNGLSSYMHNCKGVSIYYVDVHLSYECVTELKKGVNWLVHRWSRRVIAEHLSLRLLLLQRMFSIRGVWPQLPFCLGIQLKVWLVCKHLSLNAVKRLCLQKVCALA